MRTGKSIPQLLAALLLGSLILVASPAPASASDPGWDGVVPNDGPIELLTDCGASKTVKLGPWWDRTAEAFWRVECTAGVITVSGWVEDKKSDGMCARVKALIGTTWKYSPKACPKGDVEDFSLAARSNNDFADVFLYLVSP